MTKFLYSFLFVAISVVSSMAHAELRVDVNKGTMDPIPVAITQFVPKDGSNDQFATDIPKVISSDLESTGLFKLINPQSFIQDAASMQTQIRFNEWKAINAQALVNGTVTKLPDGRTRVEFRLFDVLGQTQMSGMAYMTTPQNWRRIAHIISDEIYKRLTGENGYFDSRIVYVAESGPGVKRIKRLAIMDQDGANQRFLTSGQALVLTPRFSPSTQTITYLSYGTNNKPRVYIYDLETGRQEVVGDFPGMTFAPRFSPDGNKVVMSLSQNGNSDIYSMSLGGGNPQKLTNSPGIDTAPSYSPDGSQIAFESDRGGTQQLYVMSASGGNQHRISFGEGRYASPVWSPRGDLIAFIKMLKGQFYLGVMKPDGTGERMISSAYHIEGPTWAPNGRVIAYFKESPGANGRTSKVYSIDLTGHNEHVLKTNGDGSDPAWSPLNP
ncbi:MAG: Tol-Pal system beta propeller repeat protein TolB [Alphaproteobacteria bacterium RIFCSPHIGHO2_12_FULL_45_9]|nr:MAG: Tol-Pal system beta propeller repeat protein TolB [Alphaproteobacteria bacterium RIFCSPHIGHO2_02_FULL_46_13]OFW99539.1 MAG: Tol-Pal system beta propeller repeat protein TolB [Alphaproteobacteria bacterium RIFCSPHIGHO2_12_FULL_45_9]